MDKRRKDKELGVERPKGSKGKYVHTLPIFGVPQLLASVVLRAGPITVAAHLAWDGFVGLGSRADTSTARDLSTGGPVWAIWIALKVTWRGVGLPREGVTERSEREKGKELVVKHLVPRSATELMI